MSKISWFSGKQILLGVTGGVACFKACELVRELGRLGSNVQVVMTEAATAFVTPLTFQALTGREVRISLFDAKSEAGMGHIELAQWADLILIAPTTANTLGSLATGRAPDLLTTLWLAANCPKVLAPSMNQQMWKDAATQKNLKILVDRGIIVIGPDYGIQACGDIGTGRMTEPPEIINEISQIFSKTSEDLRVMITAGPTHEPIDPVRYITNYSSGQMGFELARAAERLSAQVTLICGPVNLKTPLGVNRINVTNAAEMLTAVTDHIGDTHIFIGAAAVCDIRPKLASQSKLKKEKTNFSSIEFVENPDIIKTIAALPNRPKIVVGFAAETDNMIKNATKKMREKGLNFIIANDVSDGRIFGQQNTTVTLIDRNNLRQEATGSKSSVANELMRIFIESIKDLKCN